MPSKGSDAFRSFSPDAEKCVRPGRKKEKRVKRHTFKPCSVFVIVARKKSGLLRLDFLPANI